MCAPCWSDGLVSLTVGAYACSGATVGFTSRELTNSPCDVTKCIGQCFANVARGSASENKEREHMCGTQGEVRTASWQWVTASERP